MIFCITAILDLQLPIAFSTAENKFAENTDGLFDNPFKTDGLNRISIEKDTNEPPPLIDTLCPEDDLDPWYEYQRSKGSNAPPPLSSFDENKDGCETIKSKIYHKFVDLPNGFQIQYPERTVIDIDNTTKGADFYFNTPTDQFVAVIVENLHPTRGLPDYCFGTVESGDIYSDSVGCQLPYVSDLKSFAKSYFGLNALEDDVVDHSLLSTGLSSELFPVQLRSGIYNGDKIINSTATYFGELPALEVLVQTEGYIPEKHLFIRDQSNGYVVVDPYYGEENEDTLRMYNSFEILSPPTIPRSQPSVEIDTMGLKIRILVTFPEIMQNKLNTDNLSVYLVGDSLEVNSPILSNPLSIMIPEEAEGKSMKSLLMGGILEISFDKINAK